MIFSSCSSSDSGGDVPGDAGNSSAGETGSGSGGADGAGEGGAGGVPADGCRTSSDCEAVLPETSPADCAEAKCNPLQKRCEFSAKDADEDGHRALDCSAGVVEVETGDDCDDSDPEVFPGAWDGPESVDDEQPDRCDEIDQNCDGTADNDKGKNAGTTSTCKCDPDNPRPCYEYPNGVMIPADTLDVGICRQGVQSCTDGVPGACVGAVGPTAETCNEADDDCDGMTDINAIGALAHCKDEDGDSYCTGDCITACDTAEGYRPQTSCLPGLDCDDGPGADGIHPGAEELCGDGVDSNCTGGDSEPFTNLGQDCINGQYGVCRRTGKFACTANKKGTTCDAAIVAAAGGKTVMASDADIDLSTIRSGYDPRWDWDCDNNVTLGIPLSEGAFRASACGGSYNNACGVFPQNQCGTVLFGVTYFNCESSGGFYLNGMQLCGHTSRYINCGWEWNEDNKCGWIGAYEPNGPGIDCR
jgi:hypothetical protein